MARVLYKVMETDDGLEVYEQVTGQFCNPRVYPGWKGRVLRYLIRKLFTRKRYEIAPGCNGLTPTGTRQQQ